MQRRYESLRLHDAISRGENYVEACKELQAVLKVVYKEAPRPLQALLYEDVVHAFRRLTGLKNSQQLEAARLLHLAGVEVFSRQRRTAAAHEYKIAIIAWHRQFRNPEPLPEYLQLSGDTLLHVFEYLDARSLAVASAVCRAWNVAATDDALWRKHFLYLFDTSSHCVNVLNLTGKRDGAPKLDQDKNNGLASQRPPENVGGSWREAFNVAQKGRSSRLFASNRASCVVCKAVLWLDEPAWKPVKGLCIVRRLIMKSHSPQPMSVKQVVRYVKNSGFLSEPSSSDSDDDNTGNSLFRLWNVPNVHV